MKGYLRASPLNALHLVMGLMLTCSSGCITLEPLIWPQRVVGREGAALRLADGRVVPLPGVKALRHETPYLTAACQRGVEVRDGRPIGQMSIWHTCGSDPTLLDLVRVDLADLALYTDEGIPEEGLNVLEPRPLEPEGGLINGSWHIGAYRDFRCWQEDGRRLSMTHAPAERRRARVDGQRADIRRSTAPAPGERQESHISN